MDPVEIRGYEYHSILTFTFFSGEVRGELGRVLHVRRIPELRFQEDLSYEGAARIEQVLAEVLPDGKSQRVGDDLESQAKDFQPEQRPEDNA